MATVYLCTDQRDGKSVAVKILREELGSAVTIERFLREIDFASELDHPQIPKVLDSGVTGDLPFYAMTYVEGESLGTRLKREKQLPVDEAVRIACAAIEAMTYAHARGIVHRDIKPENILLSGDKVYVLDFGVARAIVESAGDRITSTGIAVGTPAYMSPEQALGDRELDVRSDVYSLGCVLYEMIAGIPPFVGPTAQVVMSRRFVGPPPPLKEMRESVPEGVEQAVARALCKAPADRWASAAEFSRALRAQGPLPTGGQVANRAQSRRRVRGRLIAGLLIVAGTGGAAYAWLAAQGNHLVVAQEKMQAWDFDAAEAEIKLAVAKNPEDPVAQLWLAQIAMLQGDELAKWRSNLLAATDRRADLDATGQTRLDALMAMNAREHGTACPLFARLVAMTRSLDDKDFTPTLGLADCIRDDRVVVPDASSPSGFRFRSSYHFADSLYSGLLQRNRTQPAAYAAIMPRLEKILSVESRDLRSGVASREKGASYLAQPSLVADTLVYIPYELGGADGSSSFGNPDDVDRAVARNAGRRRELATDWSRAAPSDPDSREALAQILERSGELDGPRQSGIREIIAARELVARASDHGSIRYVRAIRLGTTQIRLYLKLNQFDQAGALADSILAWPQPAGLDEQTSYSAARFIWGLNSLRGRVNNVIDLSSRYPGQHVVLLPSGETFTPAPAISTDAISLMNYAAFGGPRDSILTIARRVSEKLTALVPTAKAGPLRTAILTRALAMAAPVIGPQPVTAVGPSTDQYLLALRALAANDRSGARRLLDSLAAFRATLAPGEITMDATYQAAWLRAEIGDSAAAAVLLDNGLRGISRAPPDMLETPVLIASLVRAMMLRSELAWKMHDARLASYWAEAAFQLWGRGDPHIVSSVERLRRPN